MYIILIQYKKPDTLVRELKEAHQNFIQEQIEEGHFITAGQRNPNTGEVVLSCLQDIETLHNIISRDPFFQNRAGHFEIIEFSPDRNCQEIEAILEAREGSQ
ncbi:MAG: YciI family protein [Marinilabilia sp.]